MIKQLVLELMCNAYENGYEAEIRDLSDEELVDEVLYHSNLPESSREEILAAIKEIRE